MNRPFDNSIWLRRGIPFEPIEPRRPFARYDALDCSPPRSAIIWRAVERLFARKAAA